MDVITLTTVFCCSVYLGLAGSRLVLSTAFMLMRRGAIATHLDFDKH